MHGIVQTRRGLESSSAKRASCIRPPFTNQDRGHLDSNERMGFKPLEDVVAGVRAKLAAVEMRSESSLARENVNVMAVAEVITRRI